MGNQGCNAKDIEFRKRVFELFDIDIDAGVFRRKSSRGSRAAGEIAGCVRSDGYVHMSIDNKGYLAHRILIFLSNSFWPECVDHINGNKSDNRAVNLRAVDYSANGRNQGIGRANKTGIMGVRFRSGRNAYEAYWLDETGRRRHKNFSCDVYGRDGAKKKAAEHRAMMIDELNQLGAGYTAYHGKRKAA